MTLFLLVSAISSRFLISCSEKSLPVFSLSSFPNSSMARNPLCCWSYWLKSLSMKRLSLFYSSSLGRSLALMFCYWCDISIS